MNLTSKALKKQAYTKGLTWAWDMNNFWALQDHEVAAIRSGLSAQERVTT